MSAAPTPLRLDSTACDGCGRCAARCRPRALKVGPGYISVDWAACDACGTCVDACDRGAIVLRATASKPAPRAKPLAAPVKSSSKMSGKIAAGAPPKESAKAPAKTHAKVPKSAGVPAWSVAEGALVLVAAFALYLGVQAIPGGVAHAPIWAGVVLLAYNAAVAGLIWYLAHRRGSGVPAALRLDVAPEWASVGLAVGLALACWLVSVGYRAGAPLVGMRPPTADGADLATLFGSGVLGATLTVLVVAVVGPVLEEALLRGVVLGALRERFGVWPAIIASSLAFSLLHATVWSLLPLAVLGLALGWLSVRSRSLWPAVLAHVLYNAVFVGAALYKALGA
jgi:membrane protease YdiL (CAAX protease family)/NAD-dependent dihydropyrimidine dehydrogenase PreA subunit